MKYIFLLIILFFSPLKAEYNSSIDAMKKSDVLIVMTPWPEFKKITIKELKNNMRGRIILDPYRVLIEKKLNDKGFKYITLN